MASGGFLKFIENLLNISTFNSTDLCVKHFFGFFETLGTPVGVQLSHG
jgi:hypothetical protein